MHSHPVFLFVVVGVAVGWESGGNYPRAVCDGYSNSCLGGVARVIPVWEVGRSPGGRRRCSRRSLAYGPAGGQGQHSSVILKAGPPLGWVPFTKTVDAFAQRDSVIGAGVLLLRSGQVLAHHEYGDADRALHQPIDQRTLFHYGSITKTLTAIAILQLRDRGKLRLDDRVVTYVPELRLVHDPYGSIDSLTIAMLLSHAGGFQNPTWPYTEGKPWEPFEPTTWAQLVAMMPYQELRFAPGSRYSYSNPGFLYLARIIESITGDPWEVYVDKNILHAAGARSELLRRDAVLHGGGPREQLRAGARFERAPGGAGAGPGVRSGDHDPQRGVERTAHGSRAVQRISHRGARE